VAHHLQAFHCDAADAGGAVTDDLAIVLLDSRAERRYDPADTTKTQVLSAGQWKALDDVLLAHAQRGRPGGAAAAAATRHLLVVSPIPLVFMRFSSFEERLGAGLGIDDDMRDQWESSIHRGERARMAMTLLGQLGKARCEVTILSGDVHVGARARITSTNPLHLPNGVARVNVHQAVSSGIVHPPPSWFAWFAERLGGAEGIDPIDDGVRAELVNIGATKYLRERNWLALSFDPPSPATPPRPTRLWAQWWTRNGPQKLQLVVPAG
jgi:hypothetical protein